MTNEVLKKHHHFRAELYSEHKDYQDDNSYFFQLEA